MPFTWTFMQTVPVTRKGSYTRQWVLPIGTTNLDVSKYIVQAQGYNNYTNVLMPSSDSYDCKGSSFCEGGGSVQNLYCSAAAWNITRRDDFIYTNQ